jgi:hypothetical protein
MTNLNDYVKASIATRQSPFQRMMQSQMASLTPDALSNFNSITAKYPGMSNDLVVSMVRQGLNADTPGIDKITTIDGIAALKMDAFKLDKVKKEVKPDRGILGNIQFGLKEGVYDPFKMGTRVLFAGLRLPYDMLTINTRNNLAVMRGEDISMRDYFLSPSVYSDTTTFGALARNFSSQGSGFFVDPKSKAGKEQVKAMTKYGQINGESFTIGRNIFNSVGLNPNGNAYKVLSGIVDATFNIALDPSSYVGVGVAGKTAKLASQGTELSKPVLAVNKPGFDILAKESIDDLEKTGQIVRDKTTKKISSPYKRLAKKFKEKELDIIATEKKIVDRQVSTAQKLLNFESSQYARWTLEPADSAVKQTLSNKSIAEWFVANPKTQTGELSEAMSLLSTDMKNTGGFFDGTILLDEVPEFGKISAGAHYLDEYVVTANDAKGFKLLDLADDFTQADEATRVAESLRRSRLADGLDKLGKTASDPDFRVYNELATKLRDEAANLDGFVGSLFAVGDDLAAGKSMGALLGEIAALKNPIVMSKVAGLVESIWKVDGFTNVRSIYGGTGGVAITNGVKIAATRAEVGIAGAEFADPTNLGPNVLRLMESVKGLKDDLAVRQNEVDDLLNKQLDLEDKESWFKLLREKANGDPDILKELIQDPNNIGIRGLLKLELEVSESMLLRESIQAQIGLTDNFMGSVLDTPDMDKALKFMLGRQFEPVAKIIADETDVVRLRNLFKRKLDDRVVLELSKATTVDDVYRVLLNQVSSGADLVNVKKALGTGTKIAANPVARLIPGVNKNAVRMAENINKAFGRFYIRSAAYNLNDLTGLNTGIEDWISSIAVTGKLGGAITKTARDRIIADTQRAIFAAETNAQRAAAVSNGIGNLLETIAKNTGIEDQAILTSLKEVVKISGKEEALLKNYSLELSLANGGGQLVEAGGKSIRLEKGILEHQLLQDVINLPDSRAVTQAILKQQMNMPIYGKARSARIAVEELGDLWRTSQLVFRFAYIIRNVAEMQMRQFFSGHNTLFNNPIGFISMMIANPDGNWAQKALSTRSKLGVNALGEFFKSTDAEIAFSESIIARQALTARGKSSVGDYASAGRRATVFKTYEVVGETHPDFLRGLAWTVNRFSSDKFIPDVIRVMEKGTPEAQAQYIDDLIDTFDQPGNKLKEFLSGVYDDNDGIRELLLKNPFKETGPGVVKDNINRDNMFIWLFDAKQSESIIGQVNLLAGQGAQRNLVLDLILNGEASVKTVGGKAVTLRTPYRQKGLTSEQVIAAEKAFIKQVEAVFKPEQLTGSLVRVMNEKTVFGEGAVGKGKEFVDGFFDLSARIESKVNFGPEFDASYWDFVAGYADMLPTDDLIKLRNNANRAFAPMSKGGKRILPRVPGPLRMINNTLKQRQKNPNYVHVGGATLRSVDSLAAQQASNYVKNLFYDAAKQKQWANAARLIAPFAQAHYNTIGKWAELTWSNPVPIYKFAKAFNSATKEGSNVIYDISNMSYDDDQGFLYKDEMTDQLRFKVPVVGNVLGALAGRNISAKDALQITAPVQSLNLAFGSLNPLVPGMGPAVGFAYQLAGRDKAFGPVDDMLRDIITPFGEPKTGTDFIFPAWIKKGVAAILGNDATTQRGVKDFAAYLASTGDYGDNPLASDDARNQLFSDAESMAKWANVFGAILQSISPATPMQEVLLSIKNPNNKQNFMTMTMLYDEWDKIKRRYPSDNTVAATKFAETFGHKNLLVAISNSTPGVSGSDDAWTFLNNNPEAVDKYAQPAGDVIPYFFPGGDYAVKYTNWQKMTGARRQLTTKEIAQEAEGMVYAMLKGQIAEQQIAGRYTDFWYNEQIALLNKKFGGARPVDAIVTGVQDEKIATIGRAIQDPAFQSSGIYNEAVEFYTKFDDFRKLLNDLKVSNYAELSSKGGVPTLMRDELVALGEKLMTNNPNFSFMYFGVYAGILKEAK